MDILNNGRMKITFQTKEESNRQQREEFLKLSPSWRVISFYRMMERLKDFPTKKKENNNNFVIEINAENLGRKYK